MLVIPPVAPPLEAMPIRVQLFVQAVARDASSELWWTDWGVPHRRADVLVIAWSWNDPEARYGELHPVESCLSRMLELRGRFRAMAGELVSGAVRTELVLFSLCNLAFTSQTQAAAGIPTRAARRRPL
ncbi:MAG: hypothetical protein AAF074_17520 [Pseudomonadota bacterium]